MIIINRKKRHRLDCRKGQSPLYINILVTISQISAGDRIPLEHRPAFCRNLGQTENI